ncbi:MAG: 50S ribosomal protein L9 [Limnochordia bacterium]|jgi:large subunit ribosomal protein L9|nr:50S ribosomal protein L9 [Limnochordia bacterium]MDD2628628.1 50S ribosomal protein L9 [Limnochordia bacterium]MDD4516955.1 50S ribosomal protein L9 [Limnochordia bacterium]
MKVILKQDVKKLGVAGEVVKVKDGYARNYLFPRELAVPADDSALRALATEQKQQARTREQEEAKAAKLVEKLQKEAVVVKAKAGEGGRLFGSITAQDIADAVKETHNVEIDKRKLQLKEAIKQLGTIEVSYAPVPNVSGSITVHVVAEE